MTIASRLWVNSVAPSATRLYATSTNTRGSTPTQTASESQFHEITIEDSAPQRARKESRDIPNIYEEKGSSSSRETKNDILKGDLVGYTVGAGKTEGIVLDTYDKPFTDNNNVRHQASTDNPMVRLENWFTKQISYHRMNVLQWFARRMEPESTTGQEKAAPQPSSSSQSTSAQRTQQNQQTQTQQARPQTVSAEESANFKETQRLARSAEKVEKDVDSKMSPLHIDFAPGDIVRYRHGRNFTAGVVLDIVFEPVHDEHGNFHGATKENPMARVENLWTKKITYHHLSILEHVKRRRDIEHEHGRYADAEYRVFQPSNKA